MNHEHYEQRATRPPEYFEAARNLGEVMTEYERLTQQAVLEHQSRFTEVVPTHENAFSQEARNPGTQNIDDVMEGTKARVQWAVEPVVGEVDGILTAAAEVIPTMLDARSQQILWEAKSEAATFGIDSRYVTEVLNKAPKDVRQALKAALDADVLVKMKSEVLTFGVDSRYVTEAINGASSARVRAAMLATLDASVFAKVLSEKSTFGVDSRYVTEALNHASTPTIKAAMKVALDTDVLTKARTEASTFGIDSRYVKEALSHASSKTVRAVFERQFAMQQGAGQRSNHERTGQSTFGGSFSEDDFMRDFFRNYDSRQGRRTGSSRPGGQQRREQPQQPRQEATQPKSDGDTEVDNVVAQAVSRNRQYSWIKHESPQDIRRIINTVRKLRADAEASGTPISDRKVYLKYRAKAETNPDLTKSVQILEALMGGDVNGNLPF